MKLDETIVDGVNVAELVLYLTEGHLDGFGGYPHDYEWVGDHLVIADLNDGKERNQTQLVVIKRSVLADWELAARAFMAEYDEFDYEESVEETRPEEHK